MALCLAHATAGYLTYEALRPGGPQRPALLVAAVALANTPDLDFLPGFAVGYPTAFHRGATHTLGAAVAIGIAALFLARRWGAARPWWTATFAATAYASHLLVDWMTVDAVPPAGIQLLWPLSGAWFHAPWSALGEIIVESSSRGGFVQSLLTPSALRAWAREIGLAAATVGLVQLGRSMAGLVAARRESGMGAELLLSEEEPGDA